MQQLEIVIQETPNPRARKFLLSVPLYDHGHAQLVRGEPGAEDSLLGASLFAVPAVQLLYLSDGFITVLLTQGATWEEHQLAIRTAIQEAWARQENAKHPLLPAPVLPAVVNHPAGEDFRTRILPATEQDGGGIYLVAASETELSVQLKGACVACPYLPMTIQKGILNPLVGKYPALKGLAVVHTPDI